MFPFAAGAVQLSAIDESPGVETRLNAAAGATYGVPSVWALNSPTPALVIAATRNQRVVPFVRPGTVTVVAVEPELPRITYQVE